MMEPSFRPSVPAVTTPLHNQVGHKPWINRTHFSNNSTKDAGKLRTRERYWREFSPHEDFPPLMVPNGSKRKKTFILPDAVFWRKYLPLIQSLLQHQQEKIQQDLQKTSMPCFCILESVVEYMEYRNQNAVVKLAGNESRTVKEPYNSKERNLFSSSWLNSNGVSFFPDLSVRMGAHDDEWNTLDYESMPLPDRSRNALMRAAHMILSANQDGKVWVWTGDEQEFSWDPKDDERIQYMGAQQAIELFSECFPSNIGKGKVILGDQLQQCDLDYENLLEKHVGTAKQESTNYTTEDEIAKGLKEGNLFKTRLNVSKENPREAFVTSPANKSVSRAATKLFVDGSAGHFGKAFHNDVVLVERLEESRWGRPIGRRRIVYHSNQDDDENPVDNTMPPVPSARVVRVEQASRRLLVATMVDDPHPDDRAVLVVPMDIRYPKVRVRTRKAPRFQNQRLQIHLDGYDDVDSRYPAGHCIEILGPIGDLDTEVKALLLEHELLLDPFSMQARSILPGDDWVVTEQDSLDRKDLRNSRRVFSVDPPGCQDIDDTMHAEVLPNGDIEIGVHIADVTNFVPHESTLDREAQIRSTTFYLVDRRFDMLPSILSSNLCSLHGGVDRLAVSTTWTMSGDLQTVKNCWFGRTVIRNCAAMTYDQADRILRGMTPEDPSVYTPPPPLTAGSAVDKSLIPSLKKDLLILTKLARKRKNDRETIGGAVDLSSGDVGSELKFTLDSKGIPVKVVNKQDKEIHHTIAELMIMANTYVASRIEKSFPSTALLRVHGSVQKDSLDDLKEALRAQGIQWQGSSNLELANTLKEVQESGTTNAVVNSLFKSLATRAMAEAKYVCTGDGDQENDFSHYGLGLQKYTHFTSPIRRYADVVVHKQLLAALKQDEKDMSTPTTEVHSTGKSSGSDFVSRSVTSDRMDFDTRDGPYGIGQVLSICDRLNLQNRLAKRTSEECQKLFLSLYFKNHTETTQAVVTNLRENGFFAYVPKFDIKMPVYLKDTEGSVQVDPGLVGLTADAGIVASVGFSFAKIIRKFPSGYVTLSADASGTERLSVTVPGSKRTFSVASLDVVSVLLGCSDWDARARVPPPRMFLVANPSKLSKSREPAAISTASIKALHGEQDSQHRRQQESGTKQVSNLVVSLADVLANLHLNTQEEHRPWASTDPCEPVRGRRVFGGFENPDTFTISPAATELLQRQRTQPTRYDDTRAIERQVTARQQKLAAGMRNARKAKAK